MQLAFSLLESLPRLAAAESVRIWEFMARFGRDPSHPGLSLERVQKARDKNLWSARISSDLRAILHKDGETWTILYCGHHDDAYAWAERRQVERHAKTGALQIVESPESFALTTAPARSHGTEPPAIFREHTDDYLLSLGLPPVWLPTIRKITTEDQLLQAAERLPEEVAERLLALQAGEFVTPPPAVSPDAPASDSPDTRRRFFILDQDTDLLRMLESPFALWLVFLHPAQKSLAHGTFRGPVKVTGSAGTGKTVVALHRAAYLARQGKRVLLTTHVNTLCKDIRRSLSLFGNESWQNLVTVTTLYHEALTLVRAAHPQVSPADDERIEALLRKAQGEEAVPFDTSFLASEWNAVLMPQGIRTWDEYRTASRVGRGRALSLKQRKEAWRAFQRVYEALEAAHQIPYPLVCLEAAHLLDQSHAARPYDTCIVDELQDLGPPQLRFVAALAGNGADRLMLVGDGGQRIYGRGFSLKACGIDVRGRSHVLKVNYRTTRQIRNLAERVLGEPVDDLDDGHEYHKGTRSLLTGPPPVIRGFRTAPLQAAFIADQIHVIEESGVKLEDMAVFARTNRLVDDLARHLRDRGLAVCRVSRDDDAPQAPGVRATTMHRAKGLEFRVVFVADCSSQDVPLRSLVDHMNDPQDRDDQFEQERRLLYVSLTRARDELFVTWVGDASPFLAGLEAVRLEPEGAWESSRVMPNVRVRR